MKVSKMEMQFGITRYREPSNNLSHLLDILRVSHDDWREEAARMFSVLAMSGCVAKALNSSSCNRGAS